MLIGCDLFSSTIDFQKISRKDLIKFKKIKNLKIIPVNPRVKKNQIYLKI